MSEIFGDFSDKNNYFFNLAITYLFVKFKFPNDLNKFKTFNGNRGTFENFQIDFFFLLHPKFFIHQNNLRRIVAENKKFTINEIMI